MHTTSAVNEPASMSNSFSFFRIFPINDLFDTEIRSGILNPMDLKFSRINRSLLAQSKFVFVKKEPIPFFRKNPMAGSKTIFVLGICADFAISKLFFNRRVVSCS